MKMTIGLSKAGVSACGAGISDNQQFPQPEPLQIYNIKVIEKYIVNVIELRGIDTERSTD